jgi:hypothetical protein
VEIAKAHHLIHSDERALSQTLTKHAVQIMPGERNRILTLTKRNVIDDEKERRVWQQSSTLREVRMHHTKSPNRSIPHTSYRFLRKNTFQLETV